MQDQAFRKDRKEESKGNKNNLTYLNHEYGEST